jgi:type II secretory ATPase GspE/PulE/Tfp pilus assembly ATPase PilB-like protein
LMKIRNHQDVNISTIEDPVEYKVPGINHIQVNPEADLTFAKGLRALMRQDPNIILVGEIRDGETASIAVNAALTGHLLFSTLHANDAGTSIPRLLEMGVEPFLLASTLEIVLSQRLIRRICPRCRYSYGTTPAAVEKEFPGISQYFPKNKPILLYKGKGCDACGGIGFSGRLGIHELLVVSPEVKNLIVQRASSVDIIMLARKQGMKLLFEDGFEKMKAGVTTLEELLRVSTPPDVFLKRHAD